MTTEYPEAEPSAGSITLSEIASQPDVWPAAVTAGATADGLHAMLTGGSCVYTGCGSTAHLARAMAYRHRNTLATPAWAQAASELWHAPASVTAHADSMIAISRSGETTETIEACRIAKNNGASIAVVTTVEDSTLAGLADVLIALPLSSEISVVQTRSFSSMLTSLIAAQLRAAGSDPQAVLASLPAAGRQMLEHAEAIADQLAAPDRTTIHVLGSGMDHGLAHEGALKIKEMSRTNAEACPILDFRHGPISVVDSSHAALILCRDAIEYELAIADELSERGAFVATIGADPRCTIDTGRDSDADVVSIASLIISQIAGVARGRGKGMNPDSPDGVVAFVAL